MTTATATAGGNWLHLKGTASEIVAALVSYKVSPTQIVGYSQYDDDTDAYTVLVYGSSADR